MSTRLNGDMLAGGDRIDAGDWNDTPLLSEMQRAPWLAWLVGTRNGGLTLGVIASFVGGFTTYLAYLGCANCFCITLSHESTTLKIVFGYLAELNHGPFQILGVLVIAPLAGWLIEMVHQELKVLAARGRFFRWNSGETPKPFAEGLAAIAALNRRWFAWLAPLALCVAFSVVSVIETRSYSADHIGWVQAEFFGTWFSAKHLDELGNENFRKAAAGRLQSLEEQKQKGREVSAMPGKTKAVEDLTKKPKNITVSAVRLEPGTQRNSWTRPFVVVALTLQALSVGYFVWLGLKLLFVFALVHYLVRGCRIAARADGVFLHRLTACAALNHDDAGVGVPEIDAGRVVSSRPPSKRLVLFVDCFDPQKRYGLKVFDRIYHLVLVVLAIGATTLLLSALSNLPRGTGLLEGGLFVMLLVLVPCLALALATAILLHGETLDVGHKVRARLASMYPEGAEVPPEFNECVELASDQTAWPRGDLMFKILGAAIAMLFVFWGGLVLAIKFDADDYGKLVYAIAEGLPQKLCRICE